MTVKQRLLNLCLSLSICHCALEADPYLDPSDVPYVTCDLKGALGNQIFEIATTLAYAWDYGAIPVFPGLYRTDSGLDFNRKNFFFRLDASSAPRPFSTSYTEDSCHSSENIPFQWDQMLYGFFQAWTRFHHHRDKLLELFAPSEELLDAILAKYGDLVDNSCTVSIHVRTFNERLHNSMYHPFMGMEYFRKALKHFPTNATFVVFSDRINWCKKHFPALGKNFIFIEGNDSVFDFHLMSLMKHHIISNSSFSWWAAYLNKEPDKIVVAPVSLMHPEFFAFPMTHPNTFYLPDWIMVSPDYYAPYPSDIADYDTLSLD